MYKLIDYAEKHFTRDGCTIESIWVSDYQGLPDVSVGTVHVLYSDGCCQERRMALADDGRVFIYG